MYVCGYKMVVFNVNPAGLRRPQSQRIGYIVGYITKLGCKLFKVTLPKPAQG